MASPTKTILFNLSPYIIIYTDFSIERLSGEDVVDPGLDPATGVSSKDVVINPSTGLYARLYLPINPSSSSSNDQKLPLLVYYHGGAFAIESPKSPKYHNYLNSLSSKAHMAVVSVGYCLAPDNHHPIAYEDSWEALQWAVGGGNNSEPWLLDHVDPSRLFLAGDSSGANICHNLAMRDQRVINIEGVAIMHPYFLLTGARPFESGELLVLELFWKFIYPTSKGLEDPSIDPLAKGAQSLKDLACNRVLVCQAELDFLHDQGKTYYNGLKQSGWVGTSPPKFFETPGEGHVFYLDNPKSEKAKELMETVVDFLNYK
ncbi:putative carboxylesterase 2 [Acorus calamus]|uniref:Carboxylesterase 2 n=1 Tax=Acorus calamus TaxID=4465 RepID=A0AAV9CHM8_ACOCL|nr:putative carboxylesterase 2 [Acorus calamus]